MPAAALEITDLRVRYGDRVAVDGVNLVARAGEITAVLGPNGAGKTTTIECAEGLRQPTAGRIEVLGSTPGSPAAKAGTGVMLQDGGLPLGRSAKDVLRLATAVHPKAASDPGSARELLEVVGLAGSARTPVRRLSGGQRQRLAFAVAICSDPQLLFLDEPSAGLDPHGRRAIWDLVRARRDAGCAVVLTTHLLDEAEQLADVVNVMVAGRLVASASPQQLITRYAGTATMRVVLDGVLESHEVAQLAAGLPQVSVAAEGAALVLRSTSGAVGALDQSAALRALAELIDASRARVIRVDAGGGTLEHAYLALTEAAGTA